MAKAPTAPSELPDLPAEPVDRLVGPLARFLHIEAASGVVLLACTAVALFLANSPWADAFAEIWETKVGVRFGDFEMLHSLKHWVSDGLMAIFFFVVGLEVKREMVLGELRDLRKAALPIAAALGGMIVPAGVYLAFLAGGEGTRGWGIPMATDIAFVVGCMAVMGPRIPHSLRVMLLSLAIVDDIGAILVIAVGYTDDVDTGWLVYAFAGIAVILVLARIGVRNIGVYTAVGAFAWLAFHESGVHATIAGVILGLITPSKSWVPENLVSDLVDTTGRIFRGEGFRSGGERHAALRRVEQASREALSPLERLETILHPWVGFSIMPIFALANAGVPIKLEAFGSPAAIAVVLGLVVGKPLGIVLFSYLAVKARIASLPEGITWPIITAGGFLAGIGFTMALFIAGLALKDHEALLAVAKVGILGASAIAAVIGMTMLYVLLPKPDEA